MKTFKQFINEGVYDPNIFKAIFLAGGPGSGKSFMAGKLTPGHGFKMINSDAAFEHLLDKEGMSHDLPSLSPDEYEHAMDLRAQAKSIAKNKSKLLVHGRVGLVIDGTGRDYDKIHKQVEKLRYIGYDCYMIFVNTSLETAQARNQKRKRTLDPKVVETSWISVQSNMGKFQTLFGSDNMLIVDNNDATQEDIDIAWKKISKFADRPVKNRIAQDWIKQELEAKKR